MKIVPLTLAAANELVTTLHRHHKKEQGHRFSLGCVVDERLVGAAICGRPKARKTEQYEILEVTRLVTDGTPNACSALYGAAARTAKAMGFRSIQTFILESEPGTSLKASGWQEVESQGGGSWDRPSRRRVDAAPTEPKRKFIKVFREAPVVEEPK